MKTIIHLETDDELRSRIADLLDGKHSKRLASRAEVTDIVERAFETITANAEADHSIRQTNSADWFDEYVLETCGDTFDPSRPPIKEDAA